MKTMPLLATAVAAALTLTACSTSAPAATSSGSGTTELTWGMWIGSTADQTAWQQVADQVAADHPDLKVTIQGAPWADYWTKLTTQITSADAPCIVSIQSLRASQFTEGLVPLDDLIKKNNLDTSAFDAGALKNLNIGGSQYALPYDTGPVVMFYNADMFTKAGATEPKPGWTTADFEAAGAKLKAAGMKLYAQTAEDIFLEGAAQGFNASTPITADGTVQASDPGYVAALDWLGSLSKSGYALDADGSDGSADDNAFMAGKAATIVEGPWSLIDLSGKVKFTLGIATIPAGQGGGKTVSAGSGFGIAKTCKNPDQAFAAIMSMTSEKVLGGLADQGRAFPARTAVQSNWMKKAGDVAQVDTVMTAAQASSVPAPGSAKSEQLSQLLTQYAPEVLNGKKAAAEVMANIQSQMG